MRSHISFRYSCLNWTAMRFADRRRDCDVVGPVRTNFFSSLPISDGSQSVCGVAPMRLNTAGVSSVRISDINSEPEVSNGR